MSDPNPTTLSMIQPFIGPGVTIIIAVGSSLFSISRLLGKKLAVLEHMAGDIRGLSSNIEALKKSFKEELKEVEKEALTAKDLVPITDRITTLEEKTIPRLHYKIESLEGRFGELPGTFVHKTDYLEQKVEIVTRLANLGETFDFSFTKLEDRIESHLEKDSRGRDTISNELSEIKISVGKLEERLEHVGVKGRNTGNGVS